MLDAIAKARLLQNLCASKNKIMLKGSFMGQKKVYKHKRSQKESLWELSAIARNRQELITCSANWGKKVKRNGFSITKLLCFEI